MQLDHNTQLAEKRSWLSTALIQFVCFLWLVPVVALLILNFKKHVIGASAWCPKQDCFVGWFNQVISVPIQNLEKFDRHDHDILGAIQLVAKALEIWFIVVSMLLVYLLTFIIAGKKDGLPIGYLMRPNEFAEMYGLFDPYLWRCLPHPSHARDSSSSKYYRLRIYLYIGFTVALCILCNLMGPAAAVLALPTLQWVDTQPVGSRFFGNLSSRDPPRAGGSGSFQNYSLGCMKSDFDNWNFSCAAAPFASQLDAWFESSIAAGNYSKVESQEQAVEFAINATFSVTSAQNQTFSGVTFWIANRQLLSNLNADTLMVAAMSSGIDTETLQNYTGPDTVDTLSTYAEYNHSLQMALQRNGPVIGTIVEYFLGVEENGTWTSVIDDNREIRCYSDCYTFSPTNQSMETYTRCARVGNGWSADNKLVAFSMRGNQENDTNTTNPDIAVDVFTSDKVQYFKGGRLPSWLPPECLSAGRVPSSAVCDWERLFYVQVNDDLFNQTRNATTIELSSLFPGRDYNTTVKISVDFTAFLNFTDYRLDPSPLTNPKALVQTQNLPQTGANILVDPSWVLAAWTVDNHGVLYPNRSAVIETLESMSAFARTSPDLDQNINKVLLLPIFQTLSLIDYTTEDGLTSGRSPQSADPGHPLLTRNARLYVWAYGFGSRTSKLGLVVVSFGIAVVLAQLVVGFIDRRKYRSPTQLVVAALEHAPSDEFKDIEHDEAKVAGLRFHVQGMMTSAGKYSFKKLGNHESG